MEFTVAGARRLADAGKVEEWIHSYLTAGEWANPGLSEGLKRAPRWWVGPLEVPVKELVRKCGPEPEMKYRMEQEEWDRRVGRIVASARDPLLLPPLILQNVEGRMIVCDGSHRTEAARRKGWTKLWALMWFDQECGRAKFLSALTDR